MTTQEKKALLAEIALLVEEAYRRGAMDGFEADATREMMEKWNRRKATVHTPPPACWNGESILRRLEIVANTFRYPNPEPTPVWRLIQDCKPKRRSKQ